MSLPEPEPRDRDDVLAARHDAHVRHAESVDASMLQCLFERNWVLDRRPQR